VCPLTGARREQVQQCASGPEGAQLALEAAKATEALNPPHEYAPWLTLNGKPLRDRAYDLKVPPPPRAKADGGAAHGGSAR
jgi:hypothetical protein